MVFNASPKAIEELVVNSFDAGCSESPVLLSDLTSGRKTIAVSMMERGWTLRFETTLAFYWNK